MKQFMLYGFEKARQVDVPHWLRGVFAKIASEAGDAAVLLVYGSTTCWSTDLKVNQPARVEAAYEDVAIIVIPREQGSLTITCQVRGSDKQEVTYGFNGEELVRVYRPNPS